MIDATWLIGHHKLYGAFWEFTDPAMVHACHFCDICNAMLDWSNVICDGFCFTEHNTAHMGWTMIEICSTHHVAFYDM